MNTRENAESSSLLFVFIATLFVTFLLISNIIAVKLVDLSGLIVPAALVIFPLTYIFGDILTEVYGYGKARFVIWIGFFSNLLMVLVFKLGEILPPAAFW